jgi:predicted DsbA family dithiol-disulfide isomerase
MTVAITIFSDFACPFSYLAERSLRSLETGVATITYRAAGSAGAVGPLDPAIWSALVAAALEDGIELRMPAVLPETNKAHEAGLFARKVDSEGALRDAIFRACWRDGADIGRIDILTALAGSVGLDPEDLKIALDIDLYSDAVAGDALLAQRLKIRETPVTYFGTGRDAKVVAGGYTSAQLRTLLESGDLLKAGMNG